MLKLANPGVPIVLRAVPMPNGIAESDFVFAGWEVANADCPDTSTDTITVTPRKGAIVKANFKRVNTIRIASRPGTSISASTLR